MRIGSTSHYYPKSNKRKNPPSNDSKTSTVAKTALPHTSSNKKAKIERKITPISSESSIEKRTGTLFLELYQIIYQFIDLETKANFRLVSKEFNSIYDDEIDKIRNNDLGTIKLRGLEGRVFSRARLYHFEKIVTKALCDLQFNRIIHYQEDEIFPRAHYQDIIISIKRELGEELTQLLSDILLLDTNQHFFETIKPEFKSPLFQYIAEDPLIQGLQAYLMNHCDVEKWFSLLEKSYNDGNTVSVFFMVKYSRFCTIDRYLERAKELAIDLVKKDYFVPLEEYLFTKDFDEELFQELSEYPPAQLWKSSFAINILDRLSASELVLLYKRNFSNEFLRYCCRGRKLDNRALNVLFKSNQKLPKIIIEWMIEDLFEDNLKDLSSATLERMKIAYEYLCKFLKKDDLIGFDDKILNFLLFYILNNIPLNFQNYNTSILKVLEEHLKKIHETKRAGSSDPFYTSLTNLALVKVFQNKISDANQIYSVVLSNTQNPKILLRVAKGKRLIGYFYNDQKLIKQAIEILKKFIPLRLYQEYFFQDYFFEMIECQRFIRNFDNAMYWASKIKVDEVSGPKLVNVYAQLGHLDHALKVMDYLIKQHPDDFNLHKKFIIHLFILHKFERIAPLLNKLEQIQFCPETFLMFANLLNRYGFHQLAINYFKKVNSAKKIDDATSLISWASAACFLQSSVDYNICLEQLSQRANRLKNIN